MNLLSNYKPAIQAAVGSVIIRPIKTFKDIAFAQYSSRQRALRLTLLVGVIGQSSQAKMFEISRCFVIMTQTTAFPTMPEMTSIKRAAVMAASVDLNMTEGA